MGLLSRLLRAEGNVTRSPLDDYWYSARGGTSVTGLRVDPDTALKLSAVWACVRLISESVASLPLPIYEQMQDGKRKAPWHALYNRLQYQPNDWQTAQGWRQQMTVHALLRGAGFSRLVGGPAGVVSGGIEPLNPDWLTVPNNLSDPYIYRVPGKPQESIYHDSILRVDGLTLDGVQPVSVITYARESMGIGLAAEQYAGRVFSQDARPRGVVEVAGKLSKEGAALLADQWQQTYGGLSNAHKVAVLVEGAKFAPISVTPDDAQMLSSREFSVEDVCRWFGVPPHMVGSTAKVTSWGSGIEQLSIGFVTYTLLPWLKRWEQSIRRDLIFDKERYFAEHVLDGLLRGDQESRYRAYAIGRQGGWLSANDVRRLENMNTIPSGDKYDNPAITPTSGGAHNDLPELAALVNGRTNGHAE